MLLQSCGGAPSRMLRLRGDRRWLCYLWSLIPSIEVRICGLKAQILDSVEGGGCESECSLSGPFCMLCIIVISDFHNDRFVGPLKR